MYRCLMALLMTKKQSVDIDNDHPLSWVIITLFIFITMFCGTDSIPHKFLDIFHI